MDRETTYFSSISLRWAILSNFYPSKMIIDSKEYYHVEEYYQSQKFAGVNENAEEHVRSIEDPGLCKRVARRYGMTKEREQEWTSGMRDKVMKRAVLYKFLSNTLLLKELMLTGDNILIEDNKFDEYWACGRLGNGSNKLGEILMEIRSSLKDIIY